MRINFDFYYHHIGIPTLETRRKETYNEVGHFYSSAYWDSKFGIEWMRFISTSSLPALIKEVPHLAFTTSDLHLVRNLGFPVLLEERPTEGVEVCFINYHGIPIEFLSFKKAESKIWPNPNKMICGSGQEDDNCFRFRSVNYESLPKAFPLNNPFGIMGRKQERQISEYPVQVDSMVFEIQRNSPWILDHGTKESKDEIEVEEEDVKIQVISK